MLDDKNSNVRISPTLKGQEVGGYTGGCDPLGGKVGYSFLDFEELAQPPMDVNMAVTQGSPQGSQTTEWGQLWDSACAQSLFLGEVWLLQTGMPFTSSVPTSSADTALMQPGFHAHGKQPLSSFSDYEV